MNSIFNYKKASDFLCDLWKFKKTKNPLFSLRAWSKHIGLKNHAPLQLMISGKRAIPYKYIPLLIQTLNLSQKEGIYLETLVDFERAKTVITKSFYLDRLKRLSPNNSINNNIHMTEIDKFLYLEDPIHMIILEMTELPDFKVYPEWILHRLAFETTLTKIKEAILRLKKFNLLSEKVEEINKNGKKIKKIILTKTNKHLTTKPEVFDNSIKEYHKNVSNLASKMIDKQSGDDREYNSYALSIKKSSISKAKELIRDFIKKFLEEIEAGPGSAEETYQLNVQFFGVTKARKE